jgi:hypothetical protein
MTDALAVDASMITRRAWSLLRVTITSFRGRVKFAANCFQLVAVGGAWRTHARHP